LQVSLELIQCHLPTPPELVNTCWKLSQSIGNLMKKCSIWKSLQNLLGICQRVANDTWDIYKRVPGKHTSIKGLAGYLSVKSLKDMKFKFLSKEATNNVSTAIRGSSLYYGLSIRIDITHLNLVRQSLANDK
jgi:hypothetical protein